MKRICEIKFFFEILVLIEVWGRYSFLKMLIGLDLFSLKFMILFGVLWFIVLKNKVLKIF